MEEQTKFVLYIFYYGWNDGADLASGMNFPN